MTSSPVLPAIAILAGGKATRLGDLARDIPKALIPVNGEPFLAHQLRRLKARGLSDVVLCVGHLGDKIRAFVGDGKKFGLNVHYSDEGNEFLGTGGAVLKALPLLGDRFFVTYGDTLLDVDYQAVDRTLEASPGSLAVMTLLRNSNQWGPSNAQFEKGRLIAHDKRAPTPQMHHIDYGCSLFRKEAFLPPLERVFDLNDLLSRLVSGGQALGFKIQKRFHVFIFWRREWVMFCNPAFFFWRVFKQWKVHDPQEFKFFFID
jgi:NDP-sugar pyrophosphorylase family protein